MVAGIAFGADSQHSSRFAGDALNLFFDAIEMIGEFRWRRLIFALARRRQKHFLVYSIKWGRPVRPPGRASLMAQGGLCEKESITCFSDAAFLGNCSNKTQVPHF